eukprot:6830481-Prorocentrum_lima.AAC.1
MTSSLVGSEMCIRDRHEASVATAFGKPPNSSSSGDLANFRRQLQEQITVSYTHLTLPTICSV